MNLKQKRERLINEIAQTIIKRSRHLKEFRSVDEVNWTGTVLDRVEQIGELVILIDDQLRMTRIGPDEPHIASNLDYLYREGKMLGRELGHTATKQFFLYDRNDVMEELKSNTEAYITTVRGGMNSPSYDLGGEPLDAYMRMCSDIVDQIFALQHIFRYD